MVVPPVVHAGRCTARFLGCEYGPDLSLGGGELAGVAPADARRALAELARTHMVTEVAAGRFAVHHMLRTYAAERLATPIRTSFAAP